MTDLALALGRLDGLLDRAIRDDDLRRATFLVQLGHRLLAGMVDPRSAGPGPARSSRRVAFQQVR